MLPLISDSRFIHDGKKRDITLTDKSHNRLFLITEKVKSSLIVAKSELQRFAPLEFAILPNKRVYRVHGREFLANWALQDLEIDDLHDALLYLERVLYREVDCAPSTMATRLIWASNATPYFRQIGRNLIKWSDEEIRFWQMHGARALSWTRQAGEMEGKYIHGYDRRTQYLYAWSRMFGCDQPVLKANAKFDPYIMGYWQFSLTGLDWWGIETLPPIVDKKKEMWADTNTLKFLYDQKIPFETHAVLQYEEKLKALEPVYKLILEARENLAIESNPLFPNRVAAMAVASGVKAIYRAGSGLLGSASRARGQWFHRPDWFSFIVSEARIRLLANIATVYQSTGLSPVAVATDCIYYCSDNPDPWAAVPLSPDKFKVKTSCIRTAEIDAALEARSIAKFQQACAKGVK